jgi:hypothetical protein
MKFKEGAEPIYTSEPWYDMMVGGYIKPEDLLEGEDAEKVGEAIKLVQQFMDDAESEGLIEIG